MKFQMQFNCDTDAFHDDRATEAAAILRKMADRIEEGRTQGNILDSNGNTVGMFGFYTGRATREDFATNTEADAALVEQHRRL